MTGFMKLQVQILTLGSRKDPRYSDLFSCGISVGMYFLAASL